jgi:hypothetical protein
LFRRHFKENAKAGCFISSKAGATEIHGAGDGYSVTVKP